jgi:hypothetical protein
LRRVVVAGLPKSKMDQRKYHGANDGIIEHEVLANLEKIGIYELSIGSEKDLADAVARIANLSKNILLHQAVAFQVGLDIAPVEEQMDGHHDDEPQGRPLVDIPEEMPHPDQETAPRSGTPGQQEPIDQAGNTQKAEQQE